MFTFLLVVHAIIAAALVTVILMQRSEGGGLGMGSGPSGLMTARGAADFLTRATSVLAGLFVLMALALAAYASMRNGSGDIDTSLAHQTAPGPINAPATPTSAIPLIGAAPTPAPAAPDSLTSQALAPASAGPPATAVQPAKAETEKSGTPTRPVPSVSRLRTIDTHVGKSTVGINGVDAGTGNGSASKAPAPVMAPPVIKAPSSPAPSTPAKSDSAPASNAATGAGGGASAGNAAQPQ